MNEIIAVDPFSYKVLLSPYYVVGNGCVGEYVDKRQSDGETNRQMVTGMGCA